VNSSWALRTEKPSAQQRSRAPFLIPGEQTGEVKVAVGNNSTTEEVNFEKIDLKEALSILNVSRTNQNFRYACPSWSNSSPCFIAP
jgi:H+-transporting ATPase